MDAKRLHILQSAINTMVRYGYRRTSMEDIAKEAGISRAAIYQHFRNKENVATEAVELVMEQGFEVAEAALAGLQSRNEKLRTYLSAYMIFYHRLVFSGPHSDEILQVKKQFGDDNPDDTRHRLVARVNDLAGLAKDDEAGFILVSSADGIKMNAPDEETVRARISTLVDRFI